MKVQRKKEMNEEKDESYGNGLKSCNVKYGPWVSEQGSPAVDGTVLDGGWWNGIENAGDDGGGAVVHWYLQLLLRQAESPLLLADVPESLDAVELRLVRWILDAFEPGL
jgi:hypothetical protein